MGGDCQASPFVYRIDNLLNRQKRRPDQQPRIYLNRLVPLVNHILRPEILLGILAGKVMAEPHRSDISEILKGLPVSAKPLDAWLPAEVHLGPWFLHPARPEDAAFKVFPWAIISWTVQVFFFSAIFERIMQRGED